MEMLIKYLKIKLNAWLGLQIRKKFPGAKNKERISREQLIYNLITQDNNQKDYMF